MPNKQKHKNRKCMQPPKNVSVSALIKSLHTILTFKTLGVVCEEDSTNLDIPSQDTLQMTIQRFQCHPSIVKIRATVNSSQSFSFHQITVQEMFNQLVKLDPKKASPQEAIPAKILQANADLFSSSLTGIFNNLIPGEPEKSSHF